MKVGLVLLAIGLVLVAFTYSTYLLATKKYSYIKEDLVSYYIDLAKYLYPVPFWRGYWGSNGINCCYRGAGKHPLAF